MAGGKTLQFADDFLALMFNGSPIPYIADNAFVSPITDWWLSLHTASPGVGGHQNTNEATYTGYARVPVSRMSGGGFTVSGGGVVNLATIVPFPTPSGGAETETFVGIGTDSIGAGYLAYFFPITPNIVISIGVPPVLTPTSMIQES
jgi:hypothetical protein